jgi:hypothetical protein
MPEKKKRHDQDEFDDEIIRDEVSRIFSEHPHDYIEKMEEIGFTFFDDDCDDEEQEEARAKPINSNQQYLVSFFQGNVPLSDRTVEIFLAERRSPKPNFPLIRKYFKQANRYLLALLLHGLHQHPLSDELLADLTYFHEYGSILDVLIKQYMLACEQEERLDRFPELALDFYYATFPDGYDALQALKEKYPLGTNKRQALDFLCEIEGISDGGDDSGLNKHPTKKLEQ